MLDGVAVGGGPRDGRRELVVPLVDVLVEVLLVHQPVQVEEARLADEGEHDKLEWPTQSYNLVWNKRSVMDFPTASRTQPIAAALILLPLSGSLGSALHILD